jgi:hypothetical protein
VADAAVRAFDHKWYKGLSALARNTVDAWFASHGLSANDVKEARVSYGERGCVLVIVKRDAGGRLIPNGDRSGFVTEERSFPDRPAAMR